MTPAASNVTTYVVVIGLYMVGMVFIGWLFSRNVKGSEDYFTAKRKMNAAVTGFSYAATQMSAGTAIGSPGVTYRMGYNYVPGSLASAAAPWFTFLTIGERVRKIAERIGAMTYGDIYERRYSKAARVLYALILVVFYIPLMIGQLKACGNILQVTTGLQYHLGVIIAGIVVVLYTVGGGMYAVAWTDLIQGLIMIVGFLILTPLAVVRVGGFTALNTKLGAIDPNLIRVTGLATATWGFCNVITWSVLQIGGAAHAVVRFIIPKDLRTLRRAMGYALVFSTIIFMSVSILPTAGRILVPDLKDSDLIVPVLTQQLLNPIVGGIVLSAVLAAIMSTVDSLLLLVGAAAARDFYMTAINPKASDALQLRIGQWTTVIIGVVAMYMSITPFTAVQWLVAFAFNVGAAAFTVPVLAAVWAPKASKESGFWSMLAGMVTCLFWYYQGYTRYQSFSKWPGDIWPGILGVVISAVVMYIVSQFTPKPDEGVLETFYAP